MLRYRIFLDKNFYHRLFGKDETCVRILERIGTICHIILSGKTTSARISKLLDEFREGPLEVVNLVKQMIINSDKFHRDYTPSPPFPGEEAALQVVKDEDVEVLREAKHLGADAFVTFDRALADYLEGHKNQHNFSFTLFLLPDNKCPLLAYLQSAT